MWVVRPRGKSRGVELGTQPQKLGARKSIEQAANHCPKEVSGGAWLPLPAKQEGHGRDEHWIVANQP